MGEVNAVRTDAVVSHQQLADEALFYTVKTVARRRPPGLEQLGMGVAA